MTAQKLYSNQVLNRSFQLLDVLAGGGSGIKACELAAEIGLPRSTTFRLVKILESGRFVEKTGERGKYKLGSRVIQLGFLALSGRNMYDIAKPHLRDLMLRTGETALLGIIQGRDIVPVVKAESSKALRFSDEIGTRHPAHCSCLGKAILAFSDQETINSFLEGHRLEGLARNTITSADFFRKELERVRNSGFAVDDEEREEGLRCIGAPVRNSFRDIVGAISIAGPVLRIANSRMDALSWAVVKTATDVSTALGYFPEQKGQPKRSAASGS